jgi:hypothetical protein
MDTQDRELDHINLAKQEENPNIKEADHMKLLSTSIAKTCKDGVSFSEALRRE